MSDFIAEIKAKLNQASLQDVEKQINSKPITLNNITIGKIDTSKLRAEIESALKNISIDNLNIKFNTQSINQQAQSIGITAGQTIASGVNQAVKGITLVNSRSEIEKVQDILKHYKFDTSSIDTVTRSLEQMELKINSIKTAIYSNHDGSSNIKLTIQGLDEMQRTVQVVRELRAEETEVAEVSRNFVQNFARQEQQAQKNTAAITQYTAKLKELRDRAIDPYATKPIQTEDLSAQYAKVETAIKQLENADSTKSASIIANIKKEISEFETYIKQIQNTESAIRSTEALAAQYETQLNKMQSAAVDPNAKNSVQASALETQYKSVLARIEELRTADSSATEQIVSNIKREISEFDSLIKQEQNAVAAEKAREQQTQKNAAAITQYREKVNAIYNSAIDPNATKPVQASLLAEQYEKVRAEIGRLNNASADSSIKIRADIDAEILKLQKLIETLQKASYSPNQLRARSVAATKIDEGYKLREFIAEINKSGIALSSFKTDIGGLKTTLDGVTNSAQLKEYLNLLSNAKSEFKALKQEAAQYASSFDVSKQINKMQIWLQQNPRAAKQYGQTVKALSSELTQLSATEGVTVQKSRQVAQSFEEIKMSAQAAGLTGRTFGSSLQAAFQSLTRYVGISTLIYRGIATLRQGIRDVVDLDTALVDLQKTAKATREELSSFYYDANEQAKEFGVTTKEIISAASEWSRLGYSLNDSKTMAQVSSIFKSISPGMDMESATSGLVSTMKAYGIEANEALDGIASKINAIGNSQALSNSDIVDFLTRSSSAMAEANNSLEQTIAIGTAATEIVQDAASVGNALKTKFLRDCLYVQKCA